MINPDSVHVRQGVVGLKVKCWKCREDGNHFLSMEEAELLARGLSAAIEEIKRDRERIALERSQLKLPF